MSAEQITVDRAFLEDMLGRLDRALAKIAAIRPDLAAELEEEDEVVELDDEMRERWRVRLQEDDDVGFILDLLSTQKIAEHNALPGPARLSSQLVATAISEALWRFVPQDIVDSAFERYFANEDQPELTLILGGRGD